MQILLKTTTTTTTGQHELSIRLPKKTKVFLIVAGNDGATEFWNWVGVGISEASQPDSGAVRFLAQGIPAPESGLCYQPCQPFEIQEPFSKIVARFLDCTTGDVLVLYVGIE